jgi:ribokinase
MTSGSAPNGKRIRRILVLGSLNIDLVQSVPRIPRPGETLTGGDLRIYAGGKGANQACAAALLGGESALAGMVGKDVFADRLLVELRRAGVNTEAVGKADTASGSATIFVLPNGENSIVISPGANAEVSAEFALEAVQRLDAGDFLLCQLETPLPSVIAAMKAARAKGAITILDPAPARALPDELCRATSILTPNQTEAAFLTGSNEPIETMAEALHAGKQLQARGAESIIVKMGAQGCLIADGSETTDVPGFSVQPVDTTAAGDTFNAALAVGLAEGQKTIDAIRFANAAAALSVTKPGAISSMPLRSEVEQFLQSVHSRS